MMTSLWRHTRHGDVITSLLFWEGKCQVIFKIPTLPPHSSWSWCRMVFSMILCDVHFSSPSCYINLSIMLYIYDYCIVLYNSCLWQMDLWHSMVTVTYIICLLRFFFFLTVFQCYMFAPVFPLLQPLLYAYLYVFIWFVRCFHYLSCLLTYALYV